MEAGRKLSKLQWKAQKRTFLLLQCKWVSFPSLSQSNFQRRGNERVIGLIIWSVHCHYKIMPSYQAWWSVQLASGIWYFKWTEVIRKHPWSSTVALCFTNKCSDFLFMYYIDSQYQLVKAWMCHLWSSVGKTLFKGPHTWQRTPEETADAP